MQRGGDGDAVAMRAAIYRVATMLGDFCGWHAGGMHVAGEGLSSPSRVPISTGGDGTNDGP